jgi:putative membrane protein
MMDWYGDGPGWGGWLMMTVVMLAFWSLVILASMAVYRSFRDDDRRRPEGRDGAEQVLRDRFARGEIDAEEYARRHEVLASGRH